MSATPTLLARVTDVFALRTPGTIVMTDVIYLRWPAEARIGRAIEIRNASGPVVRTRIVGIEHGSPFNPNHYVPFLVPRDVTKPMIKVGAEVWLVADHGAPAE